MPKVGIRRHALVRVGLGLAVLAVLFAGTWQLREPRYHGKTLTQWLVNSDPDFLWIPNDVYGHIHDEFWGMLVEGKVVGGPVATNSSPYHSRSDEAVSAIQHMGTNALPRLVELMASSDLTWWEKVRRTVAARIPAKLGDKLYPYQGYVWGDPVTRRHIAAFDGFTILGTNAEPALPALEGLLVSTPPDLPLAWAIANIGPHGIVLLTNVLTGTNANLRDTVALALGLQYSEAKMAVPALLSCVEQGHASYQVLGALGRIGCDDPRLVPDLIRLCESTDKSLEAESTKTMAQLLLGLQHEKARAAGPLLLAEYRACTHPSAAAGRRFYRRILKAIAPDLSDQLPLPREPDEETGDWP
jgi:hypothetical protein